MIDKFPTKLAQYALKCIWQMMSEKIVSSLGDDVVEKKIKGWLQSKVKKLDKNIEQLHRKPLLAALRHLEEGKRLLLDS